jgi:hypothetical protein
MGKRVHHLLCNGADFVVPRNAKSLRLDYRADKQPNVRIELPSFVEQLLHVRSIGTQTRRWRCSRT